MKLFRISLVLMLLAIGFSAKPQKLKKNQFDNPLALQRADPWVTKHTDGNYYFIATAPEYDRIEIRKSKTINGKSFQIYYKRNFRAKS